MSTNPPSDQRFAQLPPLAAPTPADRPLVPGPTGITAPGEESALVAESDKAIGDAGVPQSEELSIQRRATAPPSAFAGGVLLYMAQTGGIISPWWSKTRDVELRSFWKRCDFLAGAHYTISAKLTSVPFRILPRDTTRKTHWKQSEEVEIRLLEGSEYGAGWIEFWSKWLSDYWNQDNGAFAEVIGAGEPDGPIVGPAVGLANLDSAHCTRTGSPEFPVVFDDPDTGRLYKLHRSRVMYTSQLPSPNTRMRGVGLCWTSRCISISQCLVDDLTYKQEKLGSRPPRGFLIGRGISTSLLEQAVEMVQVMNSNQNFARYSNMPILGSAQRTDIGVDLVPISSLPDGFDYQTDVNVGMNVIAATGGFPVRWVWPATAAGATKADALYQHIAGITSGPGQTLRMMTYMLGGNPDAASHMMGKFLPPHLKIEFDFQDDEQDRMRADIQGTRSETRTKNLSVQVTDIRTEREHMLKEGEITDAQFGRLELQDGRLRDGTPATVLFYSSEEFLQDILDLGVEDPLAIASNDMIEVLANIEDAIAKATRLTTEASSHNQRTQAKEALAALSFLKAQYEEAAMQEIQAEQEQLAITQGRPPEGQTPGQAAQQAAGPEPEEEEEVEAMEEEEEAKSLTESSKAGEAPATGTQDWAATVGETISGSLVRGAGGKFASAEMMQASARAELRRRIRQRRQGKPDTAPVAATITSPTIGGVSVFEMVDSLAKGRAIHPQAAQVLEAMGMANIRRKKEGKTWTEDVSISQEGQALVRALETGNNPALVEAVMAGADRALGNRQEEMAKIKDAVAGLAGAVGTSEELDSALERLLAGASQKTRDLVDRAREIGKQLKQELEAGTDIQEILERYKEWRDKGGPGSGWFSPPKGTHGPSSQGGRTLYRDEGGLFTREVQDSIMGNVLGGIGGEARVHFDTAVDDLPEEVREATITALSIVGGGQETEDAECMIAIDREGNFITTPDGMSFIVGGDKNAVDGEPILGGPDEFVLVHSHPTLAAHSAGDIAQFFAPNTDYEHSFVAAADGSIYRVSNPTGWDLSQDIHSFELTYDDVYAIREDILTRIQPIYNAQIQEGRSPHYAIRDLSIEVAQGIISALDQGLEFEAYLPPWADEEESFHNAEWREQEGITPPGEKAVRRPIRIHKDRFQSATPGPEDYGKPGVIDDRELATILEELTPEGRDPGDPAEMFQGRTGEVAIGAKGGEGSGWHGPPKGTHGPGSQGGDPSGQRIIDRDSRPKRDYFRTGPGAELLDTLEPKNQKEAIEALSSNPRMKVKYLEGVEEISDDPPEGLTKDWIQTADLDQEGPPIDYQITGVWDPDLPEGDDKRGFTATIHVAYDLEGMMAARHTLYHELGHHVLAKMIARRGDTRIESQLGQLMTIRKELDYRLRYARGGFVGQHEILTDHGLRWESMEDMGEFTADVFTAYMLGTRGQRNALGFLLTAEPNSGDTIGHLFDWEPVEVAQ